MGPMQNTVTVHAYSISCRYRQPNVTTVPNGKTNCVTDSLLAVTLIRRFKSWGNMNLVDEIILDVHALTGKWSFLSAGKRDTFNLFTVKLLIFYCTVSTAVHSVTEKSLAFLFKSRSLRTSLDCAETADVTFFNSNDLRPATEITLSSNGKHMVTILDLDDLFSHRRHVDQVEFNTRNQSVNDIPAISNTSASFVDDLMESEQNVISEEHTINEEPEVSNLRRSERLRSRPPLN
ncbi:hypothetical protein CLF_100822 [Clonorchis sinensis]|uniref:Uncharacterized protein n=1 Tax=Clonorchis sinensis TaxID=79923 RepID=G7Y4B8_CLOSI|nr:hypothetical protein CLF_100822 [Clonorchis sinensis]